MHRLNEHQSDHEIRTFEESQTRMLLTQTASRIRRLASPMMKELFGYYPLVEVDDSEAIEKPSIIKVPGVILSDSISNEKVPT